MRILVFGVTGYVGSAVADRLLAAGQEPVAAVRNQGGGDLAGVETRAADLADPASIREVITPEIDAVVHVAAPSGDWDAEQAAVAAMLVSLAGTGRALIYTSGTDGRAAEMARLMTGQRANRQQREGADASGGG